MSEFVPVNFSTSAHWIVCCALPDIGHAIDHRPQSFGIASNQQHKVLKCDIFCPVDGYANTLVSRIGSHPYLFANHRMVCKHMEHLPSPLYAIHLYRREQSVR